MGRCADHRGQGRHRPVRGHHPQGRRARQAAPPAGGLRGPLPGRRRHRRECVCAPARPGRRRPRRPRPHPRRVPHRRPHRRREAPRAPRRH
ncbi:hypothetical protein ADL26_21000, partial [Thermoactinomyces vulgaris]